ncbi:MAG: hypothetical protein L0177_10890, partial [Chloroflexi bacterium]|nr:hypothetical protein [Chloroflexota bacterium]
KHALTQEVAYGSLLQERCRTLHARIVEAIEELYADRVVEQVERLAHHALRGEVWDKTLTYSRWAGTKAMARSVSREAATWFEQALVALPHLPESRETLEQAIDLQFNLRHALVTFGEAGRIFGALCEAERLAKTLDDQPRLGRVASYLTHYFGTTGDLDRAVASGQQALALATTLGRVAIQIETNAYLGQIYWAHGDYRQALDVLRRTAAALTDDLLHRRFGIFYAVFSRASLTLCLAELGEFAEGSTIAAEGSRIADAADHLFSRVTASISLGTLSLYQGDLDNAIPVLEHGLELCKLEDHTLWFGWLAPFLGTAYTLAGRVTEALPLLEDAVERITSRGLIALQGLVMLKLSEAYLRAGRLQDATQLALRTFEITRLSKQRG